MDQCLCSSGALRTVDALPSMTLLCFALTVCAGATLVCSGAALLCSLLTQRLQLFWVGFKAKV